MSELIQQRSEEWYEARLGKATASRFKDVLATIQKGEAAARRNYRSELVVERLTGAQVERYTNRAMDFGTETEELARLEYVMATANDVEEAGFYTHDTLQAGASPDGLVGEDGLIEIKCRQIANHLLALRSGEMPPEYEAQVQGQLWITGRAWCDFVSFAPELPENAQLFITRVTRDETYIKALEAAVAEFLAGVDNEVEFVKGYHR